MHYDQSITSIDYLQDTIESIIGSYSLVAYKQERFHATGLPDFAQRPDRFLSDGRVRMVQVGDDLVEGWFWFTHIYKDNCSGGTGQYSASVVETADRLVINAATTGACLLTNP